MRTRAQLQVHADDIARREELVMVEALDTDLRGPLVGEVGAPRDRAHTERSGDGREQRSQIAEADDAERLAFEQRAETDLPAAVANRRILGRDAAGQREDEPPRELDRRGRAPPTLRATHRDAQLGRRVEIDRRMVHARRHEQAKVGQARAGRRPGTVFARASRRPRRTPSIDSRAGGDRRRDRGRRSRPRRRRGATNRRNPAATRW